MFAGRLLRAHLKRRCRAYCQSPAFKDDVLERIVFNSVLQSKKAAQHWRKLNSDVKNRKRVETMSDVEPVTLRYLDEYVEQQDEAAEEQPPDDVAKEARNNRPYSLPYTIISETNYDKNAEQIKDSGGGDDNEVNYDRKSN